MSQITHYHSGFAKSTTQLEYPVFQFGTNSVAWGQTDRILAPITIEVTPDNGRSSRTGRLPRGQERAIKEAADPAYKTRMGNARRRLATMAYDEGIDSLAKLRLANGMSQMQLAAAMRTSQSHIAKIEAGHVRLYLDTAQRLAVALGVNIDRLSALIARPEIETQVWGS